MQRTVVQSDTISTLVALAGPAILSVLAQDLRRIEGQLAAYHERPDSISGAQTDVKKMLHELRGLALTLGATCLLEQCQSDEKALAARPVQPIDPAPVLTEISLVLRALATRDGSAA
ncbi:MAG: hypothetical protein ACXIU7_11890 [Roseinatronobacter sp.]